MSVSEQTVAVPVGTWVVDPNHSHVEFAVKHLGFATIKGRVTSFRGTLVGGDQPRLEGTLDLESITTHVADRDEHLRTPDFFDTDRYPEGTFVSTAWEQTADEIVIRGDLTLRGVTRPVEFAATLTGQAEDPWGNQRIGLDLAGTIDRLEWGIAFNTPIPGGGNLLDDDVRLTAGFSLVHEG